MANFTIYIEVRFEIVLTFTCSLKVLKNYVQKHLDFLKKIKMICLYYFSVLSINLDDSGKYSIFFPLTKKNMLFLKIFMVYHVMCHLKAQIKLILKNFTKLYVGLYIKSCDLVTFLPFFNFLCFSKILNTIIFPERVEILVMTQMMTKNLLENEKF